MSRCAQPPAGHGQVIEGRRRSRAGVGIRCPGEPTKTVAHSHALLHEDELSLPDPSVFPRQPRKGARSRGNVAQVRGPTRYEEAIARRAVNLNLVDHGSTASAEQGETR